MNSSNVVALVESEAPQEEKSARSPERFELSKAIAMAHRAKCAIGAATDALERAVAVAEVAEADLVEANGAIEKARSRDIEAMAAGIRSRSGAAPNSVRKARQRVETVEDEVAIARGAVAKLQSDLVDVEEKLRAADLRVEVAVNGVLAAEAARALVERLENLKAEIPALQSILYFIKCRAGERRGATFTYVPALEAPLSAVEKRLMDAIQMGLPFNSDAALQHPATEAWAAAVAALRAAADAPLPSMD